jgi:FlaA1/EpsC-like NDP-sugar epimerase
MTIMRLIVRFLNWLNLVLDLIALNAAVILCYAFFFECSTFRKQLPFVLLLNFSWLFIQRAVKLYDDYVERNSISIIGRTLSTIALFTAMVAVVFGVSLQDNASDAEFSQQLAYYGGFLSFFSFLLIINRIILLIVRKIARQKAHAYKKNAVIVGHGGHSHHADRRFIDDVASRYNIVAIFHDEEEGQPMEGLYKGRP